MSLLTKYRVVVDTNIFISGLLFGGNAKEILRLIENSKIILLISPQTLSELSVKLTHFGLSSTLRNEFFLLLEQMSVKVIPKGKIDIVRDKKDNMFLELACEGKADFIITGDKDLLVLKIYKDIRIISSKAFLDLVE